MNAIKQSTEPIRIRSGDMDSIRTFCEQKNFASLTEGLHFMIENFFSDLAEMDLLKKENNVMKSELKNSNCAYHDLKKMFDDLEEKNRLQEQNISELEKSLEDKNIHEKKSEEQIKTLQMELSKTKEDLEQVNSNYKNLQEQYYTKGNDLLLGELKNKLQDISSKVEELESKFQLELRKAKDHFKCLDAIADGYIMGRPGFDFIQTQQPYRPGFQKVPAMLGALIFDEDEAFSQPENTSLEAKKENDIDQKENLISLISNNENNNLFEEKDHPQEIKDKENQEE